MKLDTLLKEGEKSPRTENVEISGLACDSRQVTSGNLFIAIPGVKADGRTYIPQAIENGAVAVMGPPDTQEPDGATPFVRTENPRRRLAEVAATFYGRQPENIVAVTGTNGKTSAIAFYRQIQTLLGRKAAALGTLGLTVGETPSDSGLTTPDALTLHRTLADLASRDATHVGMEASSHGLHQHRLDGVNLSAAAFTNFSRDHLDYHPDMNAYLQTKTRLFCECLEPGKTAALNADIPEYGRLRAACTQRSLNVLTYGKKGEDIRLVDLITLPAGQRLYLEAFGVKYDVLLPLPGAFQAMNVLCALALTLPEKNVDPEKAVHAIEKLAPVPGRLEEVAQTATGARIFLDYAHSPDALEKVLTAVRRHTAHDLSVLFGCGGDRDKGKRRIMGEIAHRLADHVFITDDNPRTEDAAEIRRDVAAGCPDARNVDGRADAIHEAVAPLQTGDVLVVAGKGHEEGQIIGTHTRPHSDRRTILEAVKEKDRET